MGEGFYIGSSDTLYYKREDGSLVRFALRVTEEGLKCFDQLTHTWYDVPDIIPGQGKEDRAITVEFMDE